MGLLAIRRHCQICKICSLTENDVIKKFCVYFKILLTYENLLVYKSESVCVSVNIFGQTLCSLNQERYKAIKIIYGEG